MSWIQTTYNFSAIDTAAECECRVKSHMHVDGWAPDSLLQRGVVCTLEWRNTTGQALDVALSLKDVKELIAALEFSVEAANVTVRPAALVEPMSHPENVRALARARAWLRAKDMQGGAQ